MSQRTSVSVVIPVFGTERVLPELVDRLERTLVAATSSFELVLVNDGSRDGSWQRIAALAAAHHWITGVDLARNYGQHNALLAGIREAKNDVTVTMDDDLQNPPEEIPRLLAELAEGHDVVYGVASRRNRDPGRRTASAITRSVLRRAFGIEIAERQSSFRAFRTSLREHFAHYQGPIVHIDALLSWGAGGVVAIPVRNDPSAKGPSRYNLFALARHTVTMTTSLSVAPLRFALPIGVAFVVVGALGFVYTLAALITARAIASTAFLASTILVVGGTQLVAIGVIAEYVARIHLGNLGRPAYIISTRTDVDRGANLRTTPSQKM